MYVLLEYLSDSYLSLSLSGGGGLCGWSVGNAVPSMRVRVRTRKKAATAKEEEAEANVKEI